MDPSASTSTVHPTSASLPDRPHLPKLLDLARQIEVAVPNLAFKSEPFPPDSFADFLDISHSTIRSTTKLLQALASLRAKPIDQDVDVSAGTAVKFARWLRDVESYVAVMQEGQWEMVFDVGARYREACWLAVSKLEK